MVSYQWALTKLSQISGGFIVISALNNSACGKAVTSILRASLVQGQTALFHSGGLRAVLPW